MGFFEIRSQELFAWAGFELRSSWSLPPEWLGLQVWSTSTRLRSIFSKIVLWGWQTCSSGKSACLAGVWPEFKRQYHKKKKKKKKEKKKAIFWKTICCTNTNIYKVLHQLQRTEHNRTRNHTNLASTHTVAGLHSITQTPLQIRKDKCHRFFDHCKSCTLSQEVAQSTRAQARLSRLKSWLYQLPLIF
jgi:hypothetical protein